MSYSIARRSKAEIMLRGAAGQFIVNGKAPMNQENLPADLLVIRQLIGDDHSDTKNLAEVIETEEKTYHDRV